MREFRFTAKGKDGTAEYFGHTFPYEEGLRLGFAMSEIGGESLKVNGGLGGIVAGMTRAIVAKGGPEFIGRLMANTARNGVKLDTPAAMAEAFEDNYGELVLALDVVVLECFGSFFGEHVRERVMTQVHVWLETIAGDGQPWLWKVPTSATSPSGTSPAASG